MQKLIVTSAAYRQSSKARPEDLERDPDNRLLSRGPRFHARQRGLDESSARALIIEGLLTAVLERSVDDPEAMQALGLNTLLAGAVARYLAAGKELSHG